jgi:hypothetical protein
LTVFLLCCQEFPPDSFELGFTRAVCSFLLKV